MLVMVHVRCVERAHACVLRVLRVVCVACMCIVWALCACAYVFLSVRTGKRLGSLLHPPRLEL